MHKQHTHTHTQTHTHTRTFMNTCYEKVEQKIEEL